VKYLVENGAIIDKENKNHETPIFIANKNGHKEIAKYLNEVRTFKNKKKEKGNEKVNVKGDLAIVLFNFNGANSSELTFRRDDYIIVTNWNIKNGWATGYKRNNPQEKGNFPSTLVRRCNESSQSSKENKKDKNNKIHESNYNKSNNSSSSEDKNNTVNSPPPKNKNSDVPTYGENRTTPTMYQNPNPYYPYVMPLNSSYPAILPIVPNPQYGIPVQANQPYFLPMNQPPMVSGNPPPISSPPSLYIPTPTAPGESVVQPKTSTENSSDQQKSETTSNQQFTVPPNPNMFMYFPGSFQNFR